MDFKSILIVLASSLAVCIGASNNRTSGRPWPAKPWFCRSLDCPKYNITGKGEGYETRYYAASAWVSTTVVGETYKEAARTAFKRLYKYITGANVDDQNIDMTVPVITRVIPVSDSPVPACEANFTMSFYVPGGSAPAPTNPDVFMSNLPAMTVYVASFRGFASESDWLSYAYDLKNTLSGSHEYKGDYFFTAAYDSPFRLFYRHNEVWVISGE